MSCHSSQQQNEATKLVRNENHKLRWIKIISHLNQHKIITKTKLFQGKKKKTESSFLLKFIKWSYLPPNTLKACLRHKQMQADPQTNIKRANFGFVPITLQTAWKSDLPRLHKSPFSTKSPKYMKYTIITFSFFFLFLFCPTNSESAH